MDTMITRVTSGPKHHFFGFHDIPCSDVNGHHLLALATDAIDRPPSAGTMVEVGVVESEGGEFKPLASTSAFNFPQGARQQWVGDTETFTYNCGRGDAWGSVRMDLTGNVLDEYDRAIYAIDRTGAYAICLNFSRLHRLGGYGYVGLDDQCSSIQESKFDGLFKLDLVSGNSDLMVSLEVIANCDAESPQNLALHYVTHVVFSPDNNTLAFLHRYWLADGGLNTRLMTVGLDGSDLRVHAEGFLSHFDWLSDQQIMIWGRPKSKVDTMRLATGLKAQLMRPALAVARKLKRVLFPSGVGQGNQSYLIVDLSDGIVGSVGVGQLKMDGHPMVNRANDDWLVTDTYPNVDGVRDLMLFRLSTNMRYDLGQFRKLDVLPDMATIDAARSGFDPYVLSRFDPAEFAFTRSGLHCDLHPRWLGNYRQFAFDSIHEGMRQVYLVDVSALLKL